MKTILEQIQERAEAKYPARTYNGHVMFAAHTILHREGYEAGAKEFSKAVLMRDEVQAMREMLAVYQQLAEKDLLTYERQRQHGRDALANFDRLLKQLGEE